MHIFANLRQAIAIIATITLTSTTALTTPSTRDIITADTLIQDISNINTGVLANQQAVQAYQGGNPATTLIQGTPVLATIGAIHLANRKGYADANLAPQFNQPDTKRIVDYTVASVGNSIPSAINTIISKKQAFVSSGQRDVVLASLNLLLNDHDTFSAALEQKLDTSNAATNAEAVGVVAKIHNAIQSGIDAYSS